MSQPPHDSPDPAPDTPPEVLETEPVPPRPAAPRAPFGLRPPADLRGRRRIAWTVAIAADALQWALFPFMVEGLASPLSNVVDVAACAAMVWLLGWNIAFLPSFAVKLLPVVDLVPTWTAAVWLATRKPIPPEHKPPATPRA